MLRLEGISTAYGPVQVLRDISLSVNEGEVVTIIGSNGAGKSTLLRTVSGLVRGNGGRISFKGQDIRRLSAEKIVALGISQVPEGRQLFPSLTVWENLQLGAYLRYRRREKNAILDDFELVFSVFPTLKEREKQEARTLSGGEQQMLAIGRALMSHPSLLLLDEPSMGLAPLIIQNIFDVLRMLHDRGLTILLVEQDAGVALSIANRGYVLQNGRLVLEDTGDNLLKNEDVRAIYFGDRRR